MLSELSGNEQFIVVSNDEANEGRRDHFWEVTQLLNAILSHRSIFLNIGLLSSEPEPVCSTSESLSVTSPVSISDPCHVSSTHPACSSLKEPLFIKSDPVSFQRP